MILNLQSSRALRWEFQPEGGSWKPIQVPFGGWRAQKLKCDAGTYRVQFRIPETAKGKHVRLNFAGVNYGAVIYAGTSTDQMIQLGSHIGGWMPFSVDLTPVVKPGALCFVQIEVKGREKFRSPAEKGKEGKYTVPVPAPWLPDLAEGIIRGVELEVLSLIHIENLFVQTSVARKQVSITATVCNNTGKRVTVSVPLEFSCATGQRFSYPKIKPVRVTLQPGENRDVFLGQAKWELGPKSWWWPNVPYNPKYRTVLHRIRAKIAKGKGPVHELEQRFGFREFTVKGRAYLLNGIRCNLRGDNQQEANFGTDAYDLDPGFKAPSKGCAGWPGAVDNLLRLNFNVLRIHQVPATPYMLDVCDERGLMLVGETPIRASEGLLDFTNSRDNCVLTARELVIRDRNHPSIVLWSAANELFWPWDRAPEKAAAAKLARLLQAAVNEADGTRPVIFDGLHDIGPDIINMEHYVGGFGHLPTGGTVRTDRPYGETETIWPVDNSLTGFAWFGTSTRNRRLRNDADIRNYVFSNVWPNYVPGHTRARQLLEKKVKNILWSTGRLSSMEILPDIAKPWEHPQLHLLQQSFHPVPVWDVAFDEQNQLSNTRGEWPVQIPILPAKALIFRKLVVFNDEFSGEEITLKWELHRAGSKGKPLVSGKIDAVIPCGEHRFYDINFFAPDRPGRVQLVLRTEKAGATRFVEDKIVFQVA
jgi:hypothetical protein